MEEPLFGGILEEREKKKNRSYSIAGENTVNKFRRGGSLFVMTNRRHMHSILVTTKYYEII